MLKYLLIPVIILFSSICQADMDEYFNLALETVYIPKGEKLQDMVNALVEGQINANPNIRPVKNAFTAFYMEIFTSDEFKHAIANMQMELFTYEELLKLKELMKSPIFLKYEEIAPQLMAKSMQIGNQVVMNNEDRLKELIKKEQDHIENLQKRDKELMLTNPE